MTTNTKLPEANYYRAAALGNGAYGAVCFEKMQIAIKPGAIDLIARCRFAIRSGVGGQAGCRRKRA